MASQEEGWTMEIKPNVGILDIHLKEIWNYRDLVSLFVRRDFLANYKQTILGPLWFLIQPLLTTIMFYLVFTQVAKINVGNTPPIVFYLSGLTIWNYFSSCIGKTSNVFSNNSQIFGKVYFPRLAVPVSIVISGLLTFLIQLFLLLVIMMGYYISGVSFQPNIYLLLLPILILLLACLSLGIGIIFSALTVKYKDFGHLIGFGIQLIMYATPIIYPLSLVPEKYKFLIMLNPISAIVETFRYSILGIGTMNFSHLLYSVAVTIFLLFIGIIIFNKAEKNFMDVV